MCALRNSALALQRQACPPGKRKCSLIDFAALNSGYWHPTRPLSPPIRAARILLPSGYKERVVTQFDRRLAYDEGSNFHSSLAEELVHMAALEAGSAVLDVACGTGLVTFKAAEVVGPQGSVLGLDISPGMLAQARRKMATTALPNVSFRQGDVEQVESAEGSFDAILCSSALIYFSDVPATIRRFRQWLQPGGKLVFNTPQDSFTPILGILARLLKRRDIEIEDPAAVIANEEKARQILQDAGFSTVKVYAKEGIYTRAPCEPQGYAEFGWRTCTQSSHFPIPDLLAADELQQLREEFIAEAVKLGVSLQDADGNVVDKHIMLWVVGLA